MAITLTRNQIREVDRLAVERYAIASLVLMENAGRHAAEWIDREYGPNGSVCIVCGTGNNGGDGFVIARHLHNGGWSVRLLLAGEESRLSHDTRNNLHIVRAMGLPFEAAPDFFEQRSFIQTIKPGEILVDAFLGTGFEGAVRADAGELIAAMNQAARRALVAVDVPSGLDCDTGAPGGAAIRADLTITFVARKVGFDSPAAHGYLGRVVVADIGAPRELIEQARSFSR